MGTGLGTLLDGKSWKSSSERNCGMTSRMEEIEMSSYIQRSRSAKIGVQATAPNKDVRRLIRASAGMGRVQTDLGGSAYTHILNVNFFIP